MIIINSVSNTRFSFNGIEYFRNYISVVRGDRVEIFNCYEREDIMLSLTHYSEITLNGITYSNAADLQSALQSVIYSRATLGADEVEVIEQNNIGKVIQLNYVTGTNLLNQVLTNINSTTTLISATDNPVFFTAYKSASTSVVSQKLRFQFMGGKGTWGAGGKTVLPSHLYQLAPEALLPDDITANSKSNVVSLGQISSANDFLNLANGTTRNFSDTSKLHYLSYTQDSVLYLKRFTGQPGEYDGTTTVLTEDDFEEATNSNVQPGLFTPSLKDITNIDPSTDVPITIVDNNSGNKTTLTGNQIKHTSLDGNITTIDYEQNTEDVNYTVPAKNTDDVFAMQSDINGMTITANQSASELYLKNAEGTVLATINVGFLNNEGTTFFFNETTEKLELKDDLGNVLSTVPVSAFVSNLMQSVNFNGSSPYILEFKDAENNVVDSVSFGIVNIEGLQSILNSKFDIPAGTTAQYLKGDGTLGTFVNEVKNTSLSGLAIPSTYTEITSSDSILDSFSKIQAQINNSLNIKSLIPASANLDTYIETGVYNQTLNANAASGSNYPVSLAGSLEVIRISSTLICQRYQVVGGGPSTDNLIYTRIYASNVWGPWKRLITSSDTSVSNWDALYNDRVNYLRNQADGTLGAYLGNSAASIPDANNLITGMAWLIGSTLNLPNASSHHVVSFGGSSAYQSQLALRGGNFFFRSKEASVWQPWKRFWHDGDFTSTNIANWNTAFGWGDYRQFGLGSSSINNINDANNHLLAAGMYTTSTSSANVAIPGSSGSLLNLRSGVSGGAVGQIWMKSNNAAGEDIYVRHSDSSSIFQPWKRLWHDGDFTSTNITNWNTAYSRGDFRDYGLHKYVNLGDVGATGLNTTSNTTGFYFASGIDPAIVGTTNVKLINLGNSTFSAVIGQIAMAHGGANNRLAFRTRQENEFSEIYHSGNFSPSGKADLVDGKIPASQLPSYVDDVVEYANLAAFPTTGETGKLYVAINTNLVYRWSGSGYVVTSSSLALGETSATAYRGDRGKTAYDHSQTSGNPHNTQIADISGLETALNNKANNSNTLSYKGIIPSSANLNSYNLTGFYIPQDAESNTNIPSNNKGLLQVTFDTDQTTFQTYHDNYNDFYIRANYETGGWAPWERMTKASERILNEDLNTPPTKATLDSLYPNARATFTVIAPNVEKGNMYVKTSDGWRVFTGNIVY